MAACGQLFTLASNEISSNTLSNFAMRRNRNSILEFYDHRISQSLVTSHRENSLLRAPPTGFGDCRRCSTTRFSPLNNCQNKWQNILKQMRNPIPKDAHSLSLKFELLTNRQCINQFSRASKERVSLEETFVSICFSF